MTKLHNFGNQTISNQQFQQNKSKFPSSYNYEINRHLKRIFKISFVVRFPLISLSFIRWDKTPEKMENTRENNFSISSGTERRNNIFIYSGKYKIFNTRTPNIIIYNIIYICYIIAIFSLLFGRGNFKCLLDSQI